MRRVVTQLVFAPRRVFSHGSVTPALLLLLCLVPRTLAAQAPPETVGRIEGDDIVVKGPIRVEVESGRSTTVLASGSDVTVRSGQARLALAEGGEVGVCAPAHFSLLKSGGAITLALDYGRVHARLGSGVPLTVFTPLIVATPIAIGEAPRDVTVGLEAGGAMCVLAARGAVRIEQQLTGQNLLVPQSGEITLAGGQLESLRGVTGACQCEALLARAAPPPQPKPPELSVPVPATLARPSQPPEKTNNSEKNAEAVMREEPKPPAKEEPIYKVMMPPLTFDATAPAPPPGPSAETILLVRESRVRAAVVFRGHVEPAAEPPPAVRPARKASKSEDAPPKQEVSVGARIRNFFRRLWSRGPCAGVGCG